MIAAAEIIAEVRAEAGLSQRELAARSGTSAAAICEYEAGRRVPRIDTLERIIQAAGAGLVLELDWKAPRAIDLERNGQVLADLLGLADHLPHRRDGDLSFPPFASLAR